MSITKMSTVLFTAFIMTLSLNEAVSVNTGNFVSKLYERRPQTSVFFNRKKEVTSFVDCAVRCVGSTRCRTFCHSKALSLCYLSEESGSPEPLLSDDTGLDCYSRGCPVDYGYTYTGGRCVKLHDEELVYSAARDACNADGCHLYHFKSRDLDKQPLSDLGIPGCADCRELWVGADDLQSEGNFEWSDGTPLERGDPMWGDGEPNDSYDNENCVQLLMNTMVLNDFPCHIVQRFVCQIDV